ncbi:CpXC domain-containing protein [Kibdelosporangium philippinense]|uniref:CpXC domain-containing protein n=1 Tax=Kibdelosporangium philippinense TaxID=211113 RepID=A0ABS8ZEY8_9PSEU|nr:CpXC domain-containing protein [Kibdelosporangium philippinense]MCE7006335.1 CpXC domain-containing protein [Kibdelosporangium philippinense]
MSVFRPQSIVCTACGTTNVETVAMSLHGSRVPQIVEQIVAGTFQCFTCGGCGLGYRADGPLIYVDFVTKRWIGEFPRTMEGGWASLEQQPMDVFRQSLIDLAPAFLRAEADGFTVRAVFGLDALAEKIRLLEAGIDDRAVEVAKLEIIRQTGAVMSPDRRPRVVKADADKVTMVLWTPSAEQFCVSVPTADIVAMASEDGWRSLLREMQIGPYVDLGRILLDGRRTASV